MAINDRLSGCWFNLIHGHNLVYNTCWEDPRLDREALKLTRNDSLLVITSAGCNVLDYVLQEPAHVYAVDVNPRQNALLELKLAAIRQLEFDEFFAMFGRGVLPRCRDIYNTRLRGALRPTARGYWDRRIAFFNGRGLRRSFYFHGTSGSFARTINWYIDRIAKVREIITALMETRCLQTQRRLYETHLQEAFWSRFLRFALKRDTTLSFLGVPRAQRQQVERQYQGGIAQFIEDSLQIVFTRLPLWDNYFWRVYLTGAYSPACCPEYLRPENFNRLKAGLVDRISTHTCSVEKFLTQVKRPVSRFVLLDHMDWLSSQHSPLLKQEWQAIVNRATPNARLIWRSGGLQTDFVDRTQVQVAGKSRCVGELLSYDRVLAERLHEQDRVHTYGSFHIATLTAA